MCFMDKNFAWGKKIMPALRFDKNSFSEERDKAFKLLDSISPCGFLIFGGKADDIADLTSELLRRSGRRLLFAADLEFGAGQQFEGLTRLPSAAAISASYDASALACLAGRLTAKEALSVGVNLIFAPVCDVNTEPLNPIINVRSFGSDSQRVSELSRNWIHGAQAAGAFACAKHFPGHGSSIFDSHEKLAEGPRDPDEFKTKHLEPFKSAISACVKSIMVAHMTVPAIDDSLLPATLSSRIVTDLLRKEMGFDGVVITDALIMSGIGTSEEDAAIKAVKAGCDILLYPTDAEKVFSVLSQLDDDPNPSIKRIDRIFGIDIVESISNSAITLIKGAPTKPSSFMILSDDARLDPSPFRQAAISAGWKEISTKDEVFDHEKCVTAVFAMPGAWRGRSGPSQSVISSIPIGTGVISFGDPYFLFDLDCNYALAAYDAHPSTQNAVVSKLNNGEIFKGTCPFVKP